MAAKIVDGKVNSFFYSSPEHESLIIQYGISSINTFIYYAVYILQDDFMTNMNTQL